MSQSYILATVGACGLAFATACAGADRPPDAKERAALERVLRANAFVSWDDIEFDGGRWEIDDARLRNGEKYDLRIAAGSYRIVRRMRDD